tara:strand:- start:355 stop:2679 length:2325 start_codon:yes stop_codon:yes gene_type:complete
MTDSNLSNVYFVKSNNRIYQSFEGQYYTVGITNNFSQDIVESNGIISVIYGDSTQYNPLVDRPSPIVSLPLFDEENNSITWTVNETPNNKKNTKLISSPGNQPPYTISPVLNTEEVLGTRTHYNFIGKISSNINNGNPITLRDSDNEIYDAPWDISITWSDDVVKITNVNNMKVLKNFSIGVPTIRLVKSLTDATIIPEFDTSITGLTFNSNGTKLLVTGDTSNKFDQYNLGTPYDILTATKDSSFEPNTLHIGSTFRDLDLNDSNNILRVVNGDEIQQYNLDSPSNIISANLQNSYYTEDKINDDIFVSADGTKMYTMKNNILYQYKLNKPYQVHTADYQYEYNLSLSSHTESYRFFWYRYFVAFAGYRSVYRYYNPRSSNDAFTFSSDGQYLYTITSMAYEEGKIYRYTLSEPWNINSATRTQTSSHTIGARISSQRSNETNSRAGPVALRISNSGDKIYILDHRRKSNQSGYGQTDNQKCKLLEYTLNSNYSLSGFNNLIPITKTLNDVPVEFTAPLLNSEGNQYGYYQVNQNFNDYTNGFDWNSDGSKFYIANHQNIFEHSVSSNYSIQNFTYDTDYSISSFTNYNKGIQILNDNMYHSGNKTIHQLDFTNNDPLNITLSYLNKQLDVSNKEATPTAVKFDNTGYKMYITGTTSDNVHEYILSNKNEISTAVFSQTLVTSGTLSNPQSLEFSSDGSKLYIGSAGSIYQFSVNATFSASSFDNVIFNLTGKCTIITGMRWNNNGTQWTISGSSATDIETYETENPYSVNPI